MAEMNKPSFESYRFKMATQALGVQKRCPICKKVFLVSKPTMYVYKKIGTKSRYFCSWSCMQAWERKHEGVRERKQKKTIEMELKGLIPFDANVSEGLCNDSHR